MEKLKRNTLKKLLVLFVSSIAKVSYSNGNPYRDRFQSYRQTFRIEPNPIETERIINNIIGEKKITKNLVENNKISDAKVLVYRENYGGEVAYDFFLNQIRGNSLKSKDKLTNRLANISGATMSVNSMRKLSKLSLFLASKI